MALHQVDKNGQQRLAPTVNASDGVQHRMAHNTNQPTYRTTGLEVKQRMVNRNGLIVTYDSNNKVSSVYGYIPEVSDIPVFIIAKAGFDVFTDILGITAPLT